jgi:hypothetical protein
MGFQNTKQAGSEKKCPWAYSKNIKYTEQSRILKATRKK